MGVARKRHREIMAQPDATPETTAPKPATPESDPDARFHRAALGVRLTILLSRKIQEPIPNQDQVNAAAAAKLRAAARRQILRTVQDAIATDAPRSKTNPQPNPRAESLRAELVERLDAPDVEDDIGTRSVFDIVGTILRDLGLSPSPNGTYHRRTPQDVETLCAQAAKPPTAPQTPRHPPEQPPAPIPWEALLESAKHQV